MGSMLGLKVSGLGCKVSGSRFQSLWFRVGRVTRGGAGAGSAPQGASVWLADYS